MKFMKAILMAVAMIVAMMWPAVGTAEVTVFNYEVLGNAYRVTEAGALGPITIAGTRNGTFSGAVAIKSDKAISGLKASVGEITMNGVRIPASQVQVRYAVPWTQTDEGPGGLDILLEASPTEVAAQDGRAVAGVWVTVAVPEDAKVGAYRGQLKIGAAGLAAKTVPIELTVADWRAPAPQEQRTWIEMIQSPDTLSLEYNVPLWSDKHWSMIAKSFQLIRPTGSRVVYVPLLRYTNQGNAESMVRWIRQKDGSYKQDYSIMEKYLDVAQKNLGDVKFVVFYAWDAYLTRTFRDQNFDQKPTAEGPAMERWKKLQQGLTVTMLDEATGKTEPGNLPAYTDPASRAIWEPVYAELRRRMKARGLEQAMVLGMVTDMEPSKAEVKFLHEVSGGLSWIAHSHFKRLKSAKSPNTVLQGIADVRYEAHAYDLTYQVNPDLGHLYGWKQPQLSAFLDRFGELNGSPLRVRQVPQINITGNQRGVGRLGGDLWKAIRNKRGLRSGQAFARYPENHWRGLNIGSYFLAPGAAGPVATARLENLKEGVQECEARIFIESVLLDAAQKGRLGLDLAKRAQGILDEHQRALWRSVWSNEEQLLKIGDMSGRSTHEAIWDGLKKAGIKLPDFWAGSSRTLRAEEERKGVAWFVSSKWQQRNQQLFDVAAEVQQHLK